MPSGHRRHSPRTPAAVVRTMIMRARWLAVATREDNHCTPRTGFQAVEGSLVISVHRRPSPGMLLTARQPLPLQARAKAWMRAFALPSSGTARPGPNTFSRRLLMAAPAADGGGRYSGHPPRSFRGRESGVDQGPQQTSKGPTVKSLCLKLQQPALAHVVLGEHEGEQAGSAGWQQRLAVGAVVGCDGSLDLSPARQRSDHDASAPVGSCSPRGVRCAWLLLAVSMNFGFSRNFRAVIALCRV